MAVDKDRKEKDELEERLDTILLPIFAAYLSAYRRALQDGRPIPNGDFSLEDLKYSLSRHYKVTQERFRTRAFTSIDPVEFDAIASAKYQELLDDWRENVSNERAAIISETNYIQGEETASRAKEALLSEQPTASPIEVSLLATALLKKKFDERRKIIAATETQAASESTKQLKVDAMEASPRIVDAFVVVRRWNCSFENSRDTHMSADQQRRPDNSPFNIGGSTLSYPGDPSGPAREVINCNCWLTSEVIPL